MSHVVEHSVEPPLVSPSDIVPQSVLQNRKMYNSMQKVEQWALVSAGQFQCRIGTLHYCYLQ